MTDQHTFRSVLRGYDPAEVDPHIATLRHSLEASRAETAQTAVELSKVQTAHLSAAQVVDAHARRIAALEAEAAKADGAKPTFEHLGKRIGSMLTLAETEANDLREKAKAETDKLQADTKAHVEALRSSAEREAADAVTKAEADATARLSDAKRQADDILDHADREATARREEAEAVYEHQQALATAAAADFEKTLQERRQKSAAEFAAQMQQHEAALAQAEERLSAIEREAEAAKQRAAAEAAAALKASREEAASLVEQARATADRIRRDSERELAAATSRRDAITAQLTNVRQMLGTLGGGAAAVQLAEAPVEKAKPKGKAAQSGDEGATEQPADGQAQNEQG